MTEKMFPWEKTKKALNHFPLVNLPLYDVPFDEIEASLELRKQDNPDRSWPRIEEFKWRVREARGWFVDGKSSELRQAAYNLYYMKICDWARKPKCTSPIANRIGSLYWRAKLIECKPLIAWCEKCIEAFKRDDPNQVDNI